MQIRPQSQYAAERGNGQLNRFGDGSTFSQTLEGNLPFTGGIVLNQNVVDIKLRLREVIRVLSAVWRSLVIFTARCTLALGPALAFGAPRFLA